MRITAPSAMAAAAGSDCKGEDRVQGLDKASSSDAGEGQEAGVREVKPPVLRHSKPTTNSTATSKKTRPGFHCIRWTRNGAQNSPAISLFFFFFFFFFFSSLINSSENENADSTSTTHTRTHTETQMGRGKSIALALSFKVWP